MGKRSERLLALMQALRRRRRPVTGQVLADEMGVSLRSLYRDIDTLKSMGAAIDGEAGLGFQLLADFFLPPLMFAEEELEAIVLGLRTLIFGNDTEMAETARDAVTKLRAALPPGRRDAMDAVGLFALPRRDPLPGGGVLPDLRRALREERQVRISYTTPQGESTERVIYPMALGYERVSQFLVAWCTLRNDYRSFRTDRILTLELLDAKLPEPRRTLFHRWRTTRDLPDLSGD